MRRWRVPGAAVIVGVVLVSVYFLGSYQPRKDEIAEVEADAEQSRAQQAPLRQEIKALEEVKQREAELREALELLEQLIPSGLEQPTLLVDLQDAAEGAGVELVSVTFGEPEVPKGAPQSHLPKTVLVAMPVTVVVDGVFLSITDLLGRVEVLDRAVLVGTLALTEADAGFPQLRGTWSGQAYALMPADDPLVVDPNAPPAPAAAEEPAQPGSAASAGRPQGNP